MSSDPTSVPGRCRVRSVRVVLSARRSLPLIVWTLLVTGGLTPPSFPAPRRVLTGADRISTEPFSTWIRGKRVGLITNPTGINRGFVPTAEILENQPEVTLVALFGPEHGISGQAQAGEAVATTTRVISLYGELKAPTPEMLRDIDVLVFDIQDVGARFYTFISTLFECLKAAGAAGKTFVVLDRPNPIDGVTCQGPLLEAGFESFVGTFPIPIRYGMTPGELGRFFNEEARLGADLRVVPLEGWDRSLRFDALDLSWIPPSPNMPTPSTALLYPGTCLIEGTNLSEGRGTTKPFEFIGAPWLDSAALAARLNRLGLRGIHFRPQDFIPMFSKYEKQSCKGLQLHLFDPDSVDPVIAALNLIHEAAALHRDRFEFRSESFDKLAGNSWIREMLLAGEPVEKIARRWERDLEAFKEKRKEYLLY